VTLKAVVVANNRAMGAVGLPSVWGGGIYNGAGSTLTLIHSTVEGNAGCWI
jgi:hypothetical protein